VEIRIHLLVPTVLKLVVKIVVDSANYFAVEVASSSELEPDVMVALDCYQLSQNL
jgi:hypothetical protein